MFKIERRLGYLFAAITCFIIVGALAFAAFAGDDSTEIFKGAPWWVQAILAFVGAGTLGGGGIWAMIGNFIAKKNKAIQTARNFINDLCVLLAHIKGSIVSDPSHVELWNKTFNDGILFMQDVKFLSDKTNMLRNLLINKTPEEKNEIDNQKMAGALNVGGADVVSDAVNAVLPPSDQADASGK